MSTALGVGVSPNGSDDPRSIVASGASWAAIVAKPKLPTRDLVSYYRGFGLSVFLRGDTDTVAGFASPEDCAREFNARCGDLVQAVQPPLNEWDVQGDSSSGAGEAAMFPHLKAWHDVWRGRNIPIISPACASGQPDALTQRCVDLVDAIGLDTYSASAEAMRGTLGAFGARWNMPIWVTEFPWWSAEYGEVAVSTSNPAFCFCWRSWRDSNGVSFLEGLNDLNGHASWRLAEFTKLARSLSMATVDEDIALLKKQQALTIEGMRRIAQGKITGADGVAGIIDTVDPANAGKWTPVPLPK